MADFLQDMFRSMPKVELHAHLDGALDVRTAMELMRDRGAAGDAGDGARGETPPPSYEALYRRLVIDRPLATQAELLGYYDLPIKLMQSEDALERVTDAMLRAKAADRVRYLEIRWAPELHRGGGMSVRRVVETAARAARRASERYNVIARLIVVAMRFHSLETNLAMLRQAVLADSEGLLAAVDFAGPEAADPDPTVQARFFAEARNFGLGVTLHCGELPGGAEVMRRCADIIKPYRIAHGGCAAEDEELCRLLAERGVQLDLCPTSNIQAGIYRDYAEFPAAILYGRGVPISISTDSPVISGLTLSEEYCRMASAGRLSPAELWKINLKSIDRIFANESDKDMLREEFEAWASGVPELTESAEQSFV